MNDDRQAFVLHDYVAFLRRRWPIIVGLTVVAAAAAIAISLLQGTEYSATASLRAVNAAQDFAIAGVRGSGLIDYPAQTANQAAQTATRPEVLDRVREELGLHESRHDLEAKIESTSNSSSDLVQISGSASTARGAATLANAVANSVASLANRAARLRYSRFASQLSREAVGPPGRLSASERGAQKTLAEQAARLKALSKVSTPVQVTERALPPTQRSSPHPFRNALFGAGLGLLLGLLVAWLYEALDRRLRRPDQAADRVGLPIAGALAEGRLGQVPIPEGGSGGSAGLDAFRALRTNVRFLAPEGQPRSVLVTSPLPEEGKTTVSIGLALAAATSGLRTLLVEADVRRPVHAERLGLQVGPGLSDCLRREASRGEAVQTYTFLDPQLGSHGIEDAPHPTLACLTAGPTGPGSPEAVASSRFADLLRELRGDYDLVVVDSAPLLVAPETSEIVPLVDVVLLCVRLGQTHVDEAKAATESFGRLPSGPAALVVTDLRQKDAAVLAYHAGADEPTPGTGEPGTQIRQHA